MWLDVSSGRARIVQSLNLGLSKLRLFFCVGYLMMLVFILLVFKVVIIVPVCLCGFLMMLLMIVLWTLRFGGVWHHNTVEKEYVGGLSIQGEVGADCVSLVDWEHQMNAYKYFTPFEWFYKFEEKRMQELKSIRDERHLLEVVDDMKQRGIDFIHVFVKHEWNDAQLIEDEEVLNFDIVELVNVAANEEDNKALVNGEEENDDEGANNDGEEVVYNRNDECINNIVGANNDGEEAVFGEDDEDEDYMPSEWSDFEETDEDDIDFNDLYEDVFQPIHVHEAIGFRKKRRHTTMGESSSQGAAHCINLEPEDVEYDSDRLGSPLVSNDEAGDKFAEFDEVTDMNEAIEFEVGMKFKDFKVFREALKEYSLQCGRDFTDNPNIDPTVLEGQLRRERQLIVKLGKCYRAKVLSLKQIEGNKLEQYANLRNYCATLLKYNPGSSVTMDTENGVFQRLYVCLRVGKMGFKAGCRPFIGVDGYHLKGAYKGQQLLAIVGKDANENIYPIAWAVVESKCKDS
ncbi:hypothetical protein Tsubulata_016404 [Turnera subulata]|uniref:Transposase MuDR plant domain-containing protein n=1 Tax=Turnera subulata TaxID=218843 RepID=A0A9Q0IZE7_9ROSI|nr:hypothetical protein Tsubulata_016404 [Turnera subulata]